jgi:hypothetical protein
MQARGKPYARQAQAPAAAERAGEPDGSTGAAATARYLRPDPVVEPSEAGRLRPAGPPGREPRSEPGPRGSDRPQMQRRLLPGACCCGWSCRAARRRCMRVLLRNFFVRCTPCCPVGFFPVLLQHGGTAGGRALHSLPGMPARAACCTTSCCTAALHRLVGRACSRHTRLRRTVLRGAGRTAGVRGVRGGPPRINGRHRAQALLEAMVRRAVIPRTVPPVQRLPLRRGARCCSPRPDPLQPAAGARHHEPSARGVPLLAVRVPGRPRTTSPAARPVPVRAEQHPNQL